MRYAISQPFVALVTLLLVSHQAPGQQASDPLMGNWTLNIAKSRFTPGPAPKSRTAAYEATGAGVKATIKGVQADGAPLSFQYTAGFDGKDYPVAGSPEFDAIVFKRLDRLTLEATGKNGGKVVFTALFVLSPDGKVLTISHTLADGQTGDLLVLEK